MDWIETIINGVLLGALYGIFGLGLALVRQIARRHGGDAVCLAAEGGGSRFRVDLPAA